MKHNFSAGPSILPREVIEEASSALLNFDHMDLSLIEISHRSKNFDAVMNEARNLVRDLLSLPDRYEVLFLQGGATLGFYMIPMNFMKVDGKASYANTGVWSAGAIKDAKLVGNVEIAGDSSNRNHSYIPELAISDDADYFHFTSNNTIFGTQYQEFPVPKVPIICDMSSDIFSKRFVAENFTCIYAGAQKNMGPAGAVLYIVDTEKLGHTGRKLPSYLNLQQHIEKDSMANTPSVFAVYTSMLTLRWIKKNGGLEGMEKRNREKKDVFYNELDRNGLFTGHSEIPFRSWMNATFRLNDESLAPEFDALWKGAGITGLSGHRSVGGYRASMYNALELSSVQVLVDVMKELERTKG